MEGTSCPEGTEACASVTSAFLQILATVHEAEYSRLRKPRNVLHILSTNTRRTKVVELSTGTHRVADELRRHSLSDGEGGHYSTNLDRNRYGSDNNYLFTVTRYNLESLGLCPCFVDIEIIDTRNGNETQLVTAGEAACTCMSPERAELADISQFPSVAVAPNTVGRASQAEKEAGQGNGQSQGGSLRRVASAGLLGGGGGGGGPQAGGVGVARRGGPLGIRRNPSAGRLYEYAPSANHSGRGNSGGSDLFDALLMAATGEHEVRSQGEPPVSSRHDRSEGRQRHPAAHWGGYGSHGDLANAVNTSARSRAMARRNSVSMIIENPVLAQTGGGESLLMGALYGRGDGPYREGYGGGEGEVEGEGEGEGDTAEHDHDEHDHDDAQRRQGGGGEGGGDVDEEEVDGNDDGPDGKSPTEADRRKRRSDGLESALRYYHKQSSAVNLNRLANLRAAGGGAGGHADRRAHAEEVARLKEEIHHLELELEESKSGHKAAERSAEEARTVARRAADTVAALRAALDAAGIPDPTAKKNQKHNGEEIGEEEEGEELVLRTSDQEIELLRSELADVKAALSRAHNVSHKVSGFAQERGGGGGRDMGRSNSATAAAAAAAFHLPYAMNAAAAYGMLPMFGVPALGYGGVGYGGVSLPMGQSHHNANPATNASMHSNLPPPPPSMPKVASMPAIVHHGAMSPPADRPGTVEPAPVAAVGGGQQQIAGIKRKTEEDVPAVVKRVSIKEKSPERLEGTAGADQCTGRIGKNSEENEAKLEQS